MKENLLMETKKEWGLFIGKMGGSTAGSGLVTKWRAKGSCLIKTEGPTKESSLMIK